MLLQYYRFLYKNDDLVEQSTVAFLFYIHVIFSMYDTSNISAFNCTFSITRPVVSQLMRTPRSQCKLCSRKWGLEGNGYKVLHIVYRRQSNIDQHSRLMMSMALEVIIISVKCQDDTTFGLLTLHHRGGLAHCCSISLWYVVGQLVTNLWTGPIWPVRVRRQVSRVLELPSFWIVQYL